MVWPTGELAASLGREVVSAAGLVLPLIGSVLTLVLAVFAHRQHDEASLKVDYLVASEERNHALERAEKAEAEVARLRGEAPQ